MAVCLQAGRRGEQRFGVEDGYLASYQSCLNTDHKLKSEVVLILTLQQSFQREDNTTASTSMWGNIGNYYKDSLVRPRLHPLALVKFHYLVS